MAQCLASTFTARVAPAPAARRASVVVQAASRNLWLPGSEPPAHLDGSLPGDYGFDPLNLGEDPSALKWYVQAELQNARWAMAAVAGILIPGVIIPGFAPWYEAGKIAIEGSPIPFPALFAIQMALMGWVEGKRNVDIARPGSQGEPGSFLGFEGMLKGTDQVGYPGGPFDPMGMAKGGNLKEAQTKEIKNGRLAMVAFAGFIGQYVATGKGPLQALGEHVANPWGANFATNGVSLPPFTGN